MVSPESQKQMEAMRRRMEAMMRHARTTPGAKMSLPLAVVGAGLLRGRTVSVSANTASLVAEAYCGDRSEGDGRRPSHQRH